MTVNCYDPEYGYKYQIISKYKGEAWEHADYATDTLEKNYLIHEYRAAYGPEFQLRSIRLPRKYWPALKPVAQII